ncbi:hypothetical protein [Thalassovita sp.]|uniref:hypothetical protein n=1 Tax=Thalassovita sp. TaxID=1979401 RepID=UPI0029DE7821|nr:hypothetical protein [Thalassovita sp.]
MTSRVGGSHALLSPVTGAMVLTNEFGLRVAEGWNQGKNITEIAGGIADTPEDVEDATAAVQSVLSAWQSAGLLNATCPAFPDPVPFFPAVAPGFRIGGPGGKVLCQIEDQTLAEQVYTILGHMSPVSDQPETVLTAIASDGGYAVFRDGEALSGRISLDAARFVLLREVAEHICGHRNVAAVFHAGCVAKDGQALILCGDSGRGKSTLTFGLVDAGCAYLGDDHVPLHRNGREVLAYPTAAGVKEGSWQLPEIASLQRKYGLTLISPRVGVRYIPLHRAKGPSAGETAQVRAIVVPHYSPNAKLQVEQISPEQTLIEALKSGSRLSVSHAADIAPLANLLNHVPAYRITYSSSDQSVPACLDLLTTPLP